MASRDIAFRLFGNDVNASKTFDKVGDKADKTGGRISGAFGKVGPALATGVAAAGAAALVAGKHLFDVGSKLQQMEAKGKTVFGDQAGLVTKWAEKNAAAMGMTSRETAGLAANFGDLLIPMGFSREQAAKMSTDVVGLSGALSQWSGGSVSAAEASDILAKAMLGERDGLKALGISISDADVKARLAKNGTDKLTGAALEQAKAVATQQLIFEKSTDAQAAFAKGGSPLISGTAKIKATLMELRDDLAVKLIPIFEKITSFIAEKVVPVISTHLVPAFRAAGEFITTQVMPVLTRLAGYFVTVVWPAVQRVAGVLAGALTTAFNTVKQKIEENRPQLERLGELLKTFATFIVEKVYPVVVNVLGKAFEVAGTAIGIIITTIGFLVTAFDKVAAAARWVGDLFTNIFEGIRDAVRTVVNAVIDAINFLIRAYNSLPGALRGDKIGEIDRLEGSAYRPNQSSTGGGYQVRDRESSRSGGTTIVVDRKVLGSVVTSEQSRTADRNRGARTAIA